MPIVGVTSSNFFILVELEIQKYQGVNNHFGDSSVNQPTTRKLDLTDTHHR